MGDAKLSDLFKVYHDLERTLVQLRKNAERQLQRDIAAAPETLDHALRYPRPETGCFVNA